MSRAEQLRLFAEHEPEALQIVRAMRRKIPASVQTADLDAAARMGLWDAIYRGRDIAPEHFSWYLRVRVRGSIVDELRRHDWLPRRARKRETMLQVLYLEGFSNW